MARNKDFPDEARAFIVERLAAFESPSDVAAAVKARFDIDISRQGVEKYDPTKVAGQALSDRWREVFARAREKFRRDLDDIPIANKAVRLRMLGDMVDRLREMRNYLGAAQLIEQAAKEVGGAYSGRLAEAGKASEPLEPRHPGHDALAEIAARYGMPDSSGTTH